MTFFDGAVNLKQLIGIVAVIISILLVLKFTKKIVKMLCVGGLIIVGLIYFNIMSTDQLNDIYSKVSIASKTAITKVAEVSETVKVDTENGFKINVNVDGVWYDISQFTDITKNGDTYSVTVDGKTLSVSDNDIINILNLVKN